jgi:hypothetical protein
MQATTKQVRNMVRTILGDKIYKGWGSYTWTDKVKREADMRRVAFRIGHGMQAAERKAVELEVRAALFLLGYTNEVAVTDSTDAGSSNSGTYLRIKARIA